MSRSKELILLAQHLQIPLEPKAAIDIINESSVACIDYGKINNIPFFCKMCIRDSFNTGKDSKQQQLAFFQHCDVLLLYISLISALLVLIIACFNYPITATRSVRSSSGCSTVRSCS